VLGTAPDWRAAVPLRKYVLAAKGSHPAWFRKTTITTKTGEPYEVETDGFNPKSRRPYPDAYRKTFLDPDPVFAVVARAEWQLWHMALVTVAADIANRLTGHRLLPCAADPAPWEGGPA
jgi:hypothetical protein